MRAIISLSVVVAALALLSATSVAQFPTTMNYQVMLSDDADQPLVDQAVELIFRLYDTPSGGTAAWTETHNTMTNSIGVVSVVLGSTNPLDFDDFPGLLWLEVEVDGEIMSPRRELTAAPYAFDSYGAHELAGLPASDYATSDELSTTGTINDAGNPVDWTKLKGVPVCFADGDDEVGGAGDGHSLDAYDGDPVDAVWVGANGKVGIGTTTPSAWLHVHRDTLYPCSFQLTNSETGSSSSDGLVISMSPFGDANLSNYEGGPLYLGAGGGGGMASLVLFPDAALELAQPVGQSGELKIYGGGSSAYPLHHSYEDEDGGQFTLNDDQGNPAVFFGANAAGTGGRLQVKADDVEGSQKGIDLNGNWGSTEEPALWIAGDDGGAVFLMSQSGNASVQFPTDAIWSFEILDEPGVASITDGSGPGTALTSTLGTIVTRTITTPDGGYVLALATCQITMNHTEGTLDDGILGVSDASDALPANQDIDIALPGALPTAPYRSTGSCHGLFEVSGTGSYTYYFLGREDSGDITIYDVQFTLLYFPTEYGDVDPTRSGGGAAVAEDEQPGRSLMTDAEIAAERAEAEAHHLARIERELKQVQAELAAMREEG